MKKTYPLDRKSRRERGTRRRLFWLLALGLFLVIWGWWFPRSFRPFSSLFTSLARPLWLTEGTLTSTGGELLQFLRQQKGLVKENKTLQAEVASLKETLAVKKALEEDYHALELAAGRVVESREGVAGRVIIKPDRSPYDVLLVDVGEENVTRPLGVGGLVFSGQGVLLGQIAEVYRRTAKVVLFSNPASELGVVIGPNAIQATTTGQGGGNFVVTLPRGADIKEADLVTVPALANALVATVKAIKTDPSQPFQTVFLSTPVNIYELAWVTLYAP